MPAETQKAWKGLGMEGWIAHWYTRTRRKDMAEFRRQAKGVAASLRGGCDVLEVAPGPGFFAIELAKLGDFRITGLDVSRTFVEIAAKNALAEGVKVDFRQGSASAMPFPDEAFDFIYCSAAFKNFSEPVKALDEMHRVLRALGKEDFGEFQTAVDQIRGRGREVGGDSYVYSCLKTVLGSTCDACRAGIYAPSAAIARRASVTGATRGQLKWRPPGMAA